MIYTPSVNHSRTFCFYIEAKKIEPVKPIMTKTEPSFPVVLDDITIKEGEDILLSCHVAGNPRPTVSLKSWFVSS